MRKVKVLMGIIGKGNGGLSMYMVNLFKKLDRDVFDCTFLSNAQNPYFEKDILDLGGKIEFITPRNRHPKQHRDELRKIMKEGNFDVCHIHLSSDSNIVPLVEAKKANIPLVISHCHSSKVEGSLYPKILHILNKPKLKKLDNIKLCCSQKSGEFAYGNADFKVINNGIDVNRFEFNATTRQKLRQELGITDCFVIGQIGRLVPVKNHIFTIEVFSEILKECPESRLLIVGDGPLESEIINKAKECSVADKVIFTGNVRNPEDYFSAIDCMMLPSFFEGFPLTVVEAICSGLYSFVSDNVTPEIKISELVEFINLNGDKKEIAKTVLKSKDKERTSQACKLRELGYDADELIKDMQKLYLSSVTGGN